MSDPLSPTPPTDSVRSFLKRSKLGRYSEEEQAQQKAENSQRLTEEKAQASAIPVGSRCEVRAPGQPPRRGTVMYVGTWPTETLCPALRWAVLGTSTRGDLSPVGETDPTLTVTAQSVHSWEVGSRGRMM